MSDALERLRKRQRPTVPNRDTSLTSSSQDTSMSRNLDLDNLGQEELDQANASNSPKLSTSGTFVSEQVKFQEVAGSSTPQVIEPGEPVNQASQSLDTSTSRYLGVQDSDIAPKPLTTKQSTLRLEATLSDRLQALCRKHNICREVLLEAMFEQCETDPDVLDKVVASAQEKNEYRQQIANSKRAQSMMKRFGQIG
ncbi:MAG TPA: hypothetical protein V6D07_13205 [Trichocoleus sp.]